MAKSYGIGMSTHSQIGTHSQNEYHSLRKWANYYTYATFGSRKFLIEHFCSKI